MISIIKKEISISEIVAIGTIVCAIAVDHYRITDIKKVQAEVQLAHIKTVEAQREIVVNLAVITEKVKQMQDTKDMENLRKK